MPRSYRHVSHYEEEILELRAQGISRREIGERLGFNKEQIKGFVRRYNIKQRKLAAGIELRKKGWSRTDSLVSETDKVAALKYTLDRKESRIKQLEMENKLMRDFLLLAGGR